MSKILKLQTFPTSGEEFRGCGTFNSTEDCMSRTTLTFA